MTTFEVAFTHAGRYDTMRVTAWSATEAAAKVRTQHPGAVVLHLRALS